MHCIICNSILDDYEIDTCNACIKDESMDKLIIRATDNTLSFFKLSFILHRWAKQYPQESDIVTGRAMEITSNPIDKLVHITTDRKHTPIAVEFLDNNLINWKWSK